MTTNSGSVLDVALEIRAWITRELYLPLSQWLQKERLFSALAELQRSEKLPLELRQAAEWQELQRTVEVAFSQVRFYQKRIEAGFHPGVLGTPEQFSRLPLLTKEELRDGFTDLQNLQLRDSGGVSESQTSGSTGIPIRTRHGRLFRSYHEAGQWRARGWFGVRPGDRMLALWGRPILHRQERWVTALKSFLNNIQHVPIFELDTAGYRRVVHGLTRARPRFIYGYPSGLYTLAEVAAREGVSLKHLGVRVIGSTAETLYDFQRELLEEVFGCPVSNVYGCSEFGAFAHQCPAGRMHLASEHVYLEIVDESGRPVPVGTPGKVVVTNMRNPCMPLLRYEVGDIASFTGEQCPCGRTLPVMDVKAGKIGQMVRVGDGRIFSEELFSYMPRAGLARGHTGIRQFHVIQTALDAFEIQFVAGSERYEDALRECELGLRKILGPKIELRFTRVDEIPRSESGKLKFFTSLLDSPRAE